MEGLKGDEAFAIHVHHTEGLFNRVEVGNVVDTEEFVELSRLKLMLTSHEECDIAVSEVLWETLQKELEFLLCKLGGLE